MTIFTSSVLITYLLWLAIMIIAWKKLLSRKRPNRSYSPKLSYSVLVPVRNELDHIEITLKSILSNDFPEMSYEIIVINDHSEDGNYQILEQLGENVRLLNLEEGEGKKDALALGIDNASCDVIITTDADCLVSTQWLSSISGYFETGKVHLLSGGVGFKPVYSLFDKLQAIEFSSLIGAGASAIYLGIPNMCNGANLAFLKSSYYAAGGYTDNRHIASGDDEFLMHKISKLYSTGIYFNTDPDGVVYTRPQKNLGDFTEQRKRWASKWRYYKSWKKSLMPAFIGLSNLSVITGIWLVASGNFVILCLLLVKTMLELIYLGSVLTFLKTRVSWIYFALVQIIYSFYVVYFAVVTNLVGYKWKNRSY